MIHEDKIHEVASRLGELANGSALEDDAIPSQLTNLGICSDCLFTVALAWTVSNMGEMIRAIDEDGPEKGLTAAVVCAFVRGCSVGVVLGRDEPI